MRSVLEEQIHTEQRQETGRAEREKAEGEKGKGERENGYVNGRSANVGMGRDESETRGDHGGARSELHGIQAILMNVSVNIDKAVSPRWILVTHVTMNITAKLFKRQCCRDLFLLCLSSLLSMITHRHVSE